MFSDRGLCDGLIIRPEKSYRLWCVVVCDIETSRIDEAIARVGPQRHRKKGRSIEQNGLINIYNCIQSSDISL